jgi:hypothetical protein
MHFEPRDPLAPNALEHWRKRNVEVEPPKPARKTDAECAAEWERYVDQRIGLLRRLPVDNRIT